MNVPGGGGGYKSARNEEFLSLWSKRVPHSTDDPPSPFVTLRIIVFQGSKLQFKILTDSNKILHVFSNGEMRPCRAWCVKSSLIKENSVWQEQKS